MPYQAEKDATIPHVIASGVNADGEEVATYESVTYAQGSVIYEKDIAPHVLSRLESGEDDHASSLLRYIDEAEACEILNQQAEEFGTQPVDEGEILHVEERVGDEGVTEQVPPESPAIVGNESGESSEGVAEMSSSSSTDLSSSSEGDPEKTSAESPEADASEEEVAGETEEDEVEQVAETDEAEAEVELEQEGTETEAAEEAESSETEAEAETATEDQETEASAEDSVVSDGLTELSKSALKKKAGELGIEGRSKMDEEELITAIREKQAG